VLGATLRVGGRRAVGALACVGHASCALYMEGVKTLGAKRHTVYGQSNPVAALPPWQLHTFGTHRWNSRWKLGLHAEQMFALLLVQPAPVAAVPLPQEQ